MHRLMNGNVETLFVRNAKYAFTQNSTKERDGAEQIIVGGNC